MDTVPKKWLGLTKISWWGVAGVFFITTFGAPFHFLFELTDYWRPMALIASVNESTWEHLKFYFICGLIWTLIEYAYIRKDTNNFWAAKSLSLLVTPLVICLTFYAYLGVAIPRYGGGFLAADISTGVIGVIVGQMLSSKLLQSPPIKTTFMRLAPAILPILLVMFMTFTYFPPKMFLFEDFKGYEFDGKYGILEDYTDYKFFTD